MRGIATRGNCRPVSVSRSDADVEQFVRLLPRLQWGARSKGILTVTLPKSADVLKAEKKLGSEPAKLHASHRSRSRGAAIGTVTTIFSGVKRSSLMSGSEVVLLSWF